MFAGLAGVLIGLVVNAIAPHRAVRGPVLLPALGGIVALVLWEALTWLGSLAGLGFLAYDAGWIWAITLVATAGATTWVGFALSARRHHDDEDLLHRLSHLGRARA